jgi:hypothetical protein
MKFSPSSLLFLVISIVYFGACVPQKKIQTAADSFINGDALPDAPELAVRGS